MTRVCNQNPFVDDDVLVLLLLLLQVLELGMFVVVLLLAGDGSRMRAACARRTARASSRM